MSSIRGENLLRVSAPVSLSANSHSDIPSHSPDPLHPVEEKSRASARGLLRKSSRRHIRRQGVQYWNVPLHEWNTILILTWSVIFIPFFLWVILEGPIKWGIFLASIDRFRERKRYDENNSATAFVIQRLWQRSWGIKFKWNSLPFPPKSNSSEK